MNSQLNINKSEIQDKLRSITVSKSEQQLTERESLILQANFLSEIERLYKNEGLNRKELATKINTSPSYLTQVFRGDKPLNFLTLAKIKRALNLQFEVKASFKTEIQSKNNFQASHAILNELTSSLGEGYSLTKPTDLFDYNKTPPIIYDGSTTTA